jgi:hypothetical protein
MDILSYDVLRVGLNRNKLHVLNEFGTRRAERDAINFEAVIIKQ